MYVKLNCYLSCIDGKCFSQGHLQVPVYYLPSDHEGNLHLSPKYNRKFTSILWFLWLWLSWSFMHDCVTMNNYHLSLTSVHFFTTTAIIWRHNFWYSTVANNFVALRNMGTNMVFYVSWSNLGVLHCSFHHCFHSVSLSLSLSLMCPEWRLTVLAYIFPYI